MDADRQALERRWLDLTRRTLPSLAAERRWPVVADHCFQRILLDNACEERWYDSIAGRPAYKHAAVGLLEQAIGLGEAVVAGREKLNDLNAMSLAWRGKDKAGQSKGRINRRS